MGDEVNSSFTPKKTAIPEAGSGMGTPISEVLGAVWPT
jgi:hypothetical protein